MSDVRHYAGILVTAEPGRLDGVAATIDALPGVGTHHHDAATGRCVAVLESGDRAGQECLFRLVQGVPGVREASLVYHLIDSGAASQLVLEEPAP